mmetsp:Transcript_6862/g.9447  ORF Transcript_6862/g.9447 Transcript_6862/m.9447 type:complete len:125 (-) Transcript_6862:181-555(-)
MSRSNALSALGRMGWGTHFLVYPTAVGLYFGAYKPYAKDQEEAAKKKEWDDMAKAKPVDPDYFNPFTAVPFHNNPELKYVFSEVNLRKYVNEHQINEKDYIWQSYHDSYDHGNKKRHLYNWSSI